MTRLVVFLAFLISLPLIFSLSFYNKYSVNNEPFQKEDVRKELADKKLLFAELKKIQLEEAAKLNASTEEAPTEEKREITVVLDTEELVNGHRVYTKTGKCLTCHGKYGEGKKSQASPRISGQYEWYLANQLIAMKTKKRSNPKMDIYLKNLNEKDLKDVATYLSKLPWD